MTGEFPLAVVWMRETSCPCLCVVCNTLNALVQFGSLALAMQPISRTQCLCHYNATFHDKKPAPGEYVRFGW